MSEAELTSHDKVIIVAHHLPLQIARGAKGGYVVEWDDERGLDREGMRLPTSVTYIGCIEMDVPDLQEQEAVEKLLFEQYGCIVLFLEPEMKAKYYHGFCRNYLAPIMHNQMHVTKDVDPFQRDEWSAYCKVNQLFATKVLEVYSGDEMIWIHDYHLLLLPSCIVRKMHLAKIGFFLHAPFPASDVWRTVAVRLEILRSMLNVDLMGFLMFEYTRNFLTCCKRMLALEYEFRRGGFLVRNLSNPHHGSGSAPHESRAGWAEASGRVGRGGMARGGMGRGHRTPGAPTFAALLRGRLR